MADVQDNIGTTSHAMDYLVTLRGRAGVYMHPTWLVYATGGAALLGVEAKSTLTGSKASDVLTGWTLGAGTEIDWRRHMILFAKYLYTDFGSDSYSLDGVAERADFDGHLVRFGLKFKVGHDYYRDDYVRITK